MDKTNSYINRLVKCGYTVDAATSVYLDFIRNFSIAELEIYVRHVERDSYVGLLQP